MIKFMWSHCKLWDFGFNCKDDGNETQEYQDEMQHHIKRRMNK